MPDPWGRFTSTGELAAAFRDFAARLCGSCAPLNGRIGAAADDSTLLAIATSAAPGQSHPDLMLAAVH